MTGKRPPEASDDEPPPKKARVEEAKDSGRTISQKDFMDMNEPSFHALSPSTEEEEVPNVKAERLIIDFDSDSDADSDNSVDIDGENKVRRWLRKQQMQGKGPRELLQLFGCSLPPYGDVLPDAVLWNFLVNVVMDVYIEQTARHRLPEYSSVEDACQLLDKSSNIMVLTGAGISVSCGIPDFRSYNGIYARLKAEYDLPTPESMFDIRYFLKDPLPFFDFAKELFPGQFQPSPVHRFIRLLETKGKLLRNYTQNIDTLEQVVGVERVIQCHGSFATATCTRCKYKADGESLRSDIFAGRVPLCPRCEDKDVDRSVLGPPPRPKPQPSEEGGMSPGPPFPRMVTEEEMVGRRAWVDVGIMKPDIVFFHEKLPSVFHRNIRGDRDKVDLLVVIGSSLKVHPVASVLGFLPRDVPYILINRETVGRPHKFDVELLGNGDAVVSHLCNRLGWNIGEERKPVEDPPFLPPNRHLFEGAQPFVSPGSSEDDDDDDDAKVEQGNKDTTAMGSTERVPPALEGRSLPQQQTHGVGHKGQPTSAHDPSLRVTASSPLTTAPSPHNWTLLPSPSPSPSSSPSPQKVLRRLPALSLLPPHASGATTELAAKSCAPADSYTSPTAPAALVAMSPHSDSEHEGQEREQQPTSIAWDVGALPRLPADAVWQVGRPRRTDWAP